ncbi:hypothetical protein ACX27_01340 [Nostoc piscinale CENA21]|uniref:Uncharacterized protein n=1 Tax=Nostoc piscinale CENA21 TaxID=224013 RepID=A0A0M4SU23_9NOSO|nr:hypothetical protein [Nostoc piscinale]ALF51796.1 hypothetical protein ACX27_01340 [Nostoc piscinale CENA21]
MLKLKLYKEVMRKLLFSIGVILTVILPSDVVHTQSNEPSISYLGNYPSDKWGSWTERLQGVGNNHDSWFFTQKEVLWKVPLSINLDNSKNMWPGRSGFPGVLRVEMPEVLKREGFDHFGDLDALNGYIFIPIERSSTETPAIGVFREDDLSFVSYALLKNRTRSGWCSITPNGQLFTSHNKIDSNNPIDVYDIDWETLRNQGKLNLKFSHNFYLTGIPKEYGESLSPYIQGGDFSTDGKYLFLLNGKTGINETHSRGIWMFKNDNYKWGVFVTKSIQDGQNFRYEYKPALLQEPEGITYWDIDPYGSPEVGGQLHALLLNIRYRKDSIWFKHYRLR